MICKICKREINLTVFGAPKDICWGCLKKQEQTEVLNTNLTLSKTIPVIKSKKSIRQNK